MSVVGAALRGFGRALKLGKQKTTGKEVNSSVKPNPSTKDSKHKVALAKIPGQVKKKYGSMTKDMDDASRSFRRVTQKFRGEKVTKSVVSKGKDKK